MTFPSELRERTMSTRRATSNGPSVPPPRAYTEFLRALNPVFMDSDGAEAGFPRCTYTRRRPSPISVPSSASSASLSTGTSGTSTPRSIRPRSPASDPQSTRSLAPLRHLGLPPPYSPSSACPYSPYSAIRSPFSPFELRLTYTEPPRSAREGSLSIQHIVTHTVTLKRAPSLDPPPKGKRRRTDKSEDK